MRGMTSFATVVPLVLAEGAGVGEWVLTLVLLGGSALACYVLAKKKHRNTALAIVLGLFLNWMAVIWYLVIRALPEPSVAPPGSLPAPSEGDRSVRSGAIGVVVAVLSSLVVWGLASTLTGGEGDLGPGLPMVSVFVGGVIAVSYLGVSAIWHGVSGLRKAHETGRPARAPIGLALGVLDLCAVVGAVVVAASAANA
jgi:predicted membrane channel-forming protein YqfA (hemolysin III family)